MYRRKDDCTESQIPFRSKIDLAIEIIENHHPVDDRVYVLADSWYTNQSLPKVCDQKGFYYIGCLKINATIYPMGIPVSIKHFASRLDPRDLRSVTVDGKRYKIYVYEGKVSKISNATVILSWKDKYDPDVPPFALTCTDVSLDSVTVMTYYAKRWGIEIGYRHLKESQGFDQYQVRSMKAIHRFWEFQFLTPLYLLRISTP